MKLLRLICLIFAPIVSNAQSSTSSKPDVEPMKNLVRAFMSENKTNWKLTDKDIANWMFSDMYADKNGTTHLYVQQQVKGINIFNAVSSVSVQDGKVRSFAKRLYPDAAGKSNTSTPSITALIAIQRTAAHLGLKMDNQPKLISSAKTLHRFYYSSKEISSKKIKVELVYQPIKNTLKLAWDVNIRMKDGKHWWNVRVDAVNGDILEKNDWTVHCDFGAPAGASSASTATSNTPALLTIPGNGNQVNAVPSYRVYPLPLEAPSFGPSVLLPDPSDPTASPYTWQDTNGVAGPEFTITRGNNVFAYDDIANANAPGSSADGTASLTFNFPTNFTQQPVTYLNASITNLFYLNNMMHDNMFHYGFDEASGNFQAKNYTHTGNGDDYVLAECQDGGGTNNANFSTPVDGQNGVMQMYLWTSSVSSVLVVNSPAPIAGNYSAVPAGFGPAVTAPITNDLVLVNDGTGTVTDACDPLVNGAAMSGKIALIDRGICNFVDKVLEVQNAGAIAAIIINNVAGAAFAMSDNGNGGSVTIPSEMISLADGNTIKASIAGGATVNATLDPPPSGSVNLDGSLDNGVVCHEYGHGISTRLTGGPMNSSCLDNAEEAGEGWSDFFALMFTTPIGAVGTTARGMGTYATGEPTNGYGIRRYPYSTDMTIDPETYGLMTSSGEVHDIGEIWCTVLWDMNWALVGQFGFDPDWKHGVSGNNIALKLVIEGLKLQPCNPGFLDARDAILQADVNLYGGVHTCLIWSTFARRGMGFNAIQGSSNSTSDQVEDFSLPSSCLVATLPPIANFSSNITTTCHGIVHFNDSSTNTPQAWRWNFGDGDTSIIQNPTHTYTVPGTYDVTLIVSNTLGTDTFIRHAFINITSPAAPTYSGVTNICGGGSTTLTATVTPGNVAEWRDVNDSLLFTGTIFTTPVLNTNTTYHLTQYAPTPIQNVGPVDGSIGAGTHLVSAFEGHILFTTYSPMRLISAWVDDSLPGPHTVALYSAGGTTLVQAITVNILAGQSRINLNFDIPIPGNYEIGVPPIGGVNLFRNSGGVNYPYTINGLVSLTNSNANTNPSSRYYYLYDWEVQDLPCISSPLPVTVSMNAPTSSFTFNPTGLSVQFTNTSGGSPTSFLWNFGNGDTSIQQNPLYTYPNTGTFTVSLTLTFPNGCQSTTSHVLTVTPVGINEITSENIEANYFGHDLTVKFPTQVENARIRVYDPVGKLLLDKTSFYGKLFTTSLQNISCEFILLNVEESKKNYSKKIVLLK